MSSVGIYGFSYILPDAGKQRACSKINWTEKNRALLFNFIEGVRRLAATMRGQDWLRIQFYRPNIIDRLTVNNYILANRYLIDR